jgi:hypothetical protein
LHGANRLPRSSALESQTENAYSLPVDNIPHRTRAGPPGWAEVLAESEAEAEAGLVVPGEVVRQELLDSIARMEAKGAGRKAKAATRG